MWMTSTTLVAKNAVYSFVLLINLCSFFLFQNNYWDDYMKMQDGYIDFLYMFNVIQSLMNLALIVLSLWLLYGTNKESWIDRIPEKIKSRFQKIKKFFSKKRKP